MFVVEAKNDRGEQMVFHGFTWDHSYVWASRPLAALISDMFPDRFSLDDAYGYTLGVRARYPWAIDQ